MHNNKDKVKIKLPEIKISLSIRGAKHSDMYTIDSSESAAKVFRTLFNDGTINYTEEFIAIFLNQANKVIGYQKHSSGGMTGTVADKRVIATIALKAGANQVIIAHNHPSGNLKASEADRVLTRDLRDGLQLLDIKLLDHLIMTDESYLSMGDEGYI